MTIEDPNAGPSDPDPQPPSTRGLGAVLVFDEHPNPVAVVDPNGGNRYNFPVTVTTGPRGGQGEPGDQNVLVLPFGQTTPPSDTPNGTILYRLLEDPT